MMFPSFILMTRSELRARVSSWVTMMNVLPVACLRSKEKPVEFGTVMAVETAGRFVGKNYFRVVDERAGHCGALAFAA